MMFAYITEMGALIALGIEPFAPWMVRIDVAGVTRFLWARDARSVAQWLQGEDPLLRPKRAAAAVRGLPWGICRDADAPDLIIDGALFLGASRFPIAEKLGELAERAIHTQRREQST